MSHESKKKILKRNKRHLIIFQLAQIAQEEDKRHHEDLSHLSARGRVERQRGGHKGPKDTAVGAKLQQFRNKNDGSKRQAADRWNRFAGTEGGGGKGL